MIPSILIPERECPDVVPVALDRMTLDDDSTEVLSVAGTVLVGRLDGFHLEVRGGVGCLLLGHGALSSIAG